jgi:hypothetical protein
MIAWCAEIYIDSVNCFMWYLTLWILKLSFYFLEFSFEESHLPSEPPFLKFYKIIVVDTYVGQVLHLPGDIQTFRDRHDIGSFVVEHLDTNLLFPRLLVQYWRKIKNLTLFKYPYNKLTPVKVVQKSTSPTYRYENNCLYCIRQCEEKELFLLWLVGSDWYNRWCAN